MSREHQQLNFRVPHEILEEFKLEAKKEKRSVTAQLNAIIEEWLEKQKQKESAKA